MSAFTIADGYTASKQIGARPGLHPACLAEFRPALARKRAEYAEKAKLGAEKVSAWEDQLVEAHLVSLDGDPLPKGDAARLVPALREQILSLILGYEPADERADGKN